MLKKNKIILIGGLLILLFITTTVISFSIYNNNQETISFSIDGSKSVVLGKTDYGTVTRTGPYGNTSSPVKIAYIVGVHPLEYNAHQALIKSIKENSSSLKYCYYIYVVNVTSNRNDYDKGRMNGQLLAKEYVVGDISKEDYDLAIDIHSNSGNWEENRFIFTPIASGQSKSYAQMIKNKLSWLAYYTPPKATSTEYVTVPIIKSGTPAVLYETYRSEPYDVTKKHASEFVSVVDNLSIKN